MVLGYDESVVYVGVHTIWDENIFRCVVAKRIKSINFKKL